MGEVKVSNSRSSQRTLTVLAALFSFGMVLVAWHAATAWFGVPNYILPSLRELYDSAWYGLVDGVLHEHIRFTLTATIVGLAAGTVLGFLVGVLVTEIPILERAIYPIVIAIQSIPKVALAPLIIVYFGFGIESKIFTVALLVFFPIFINTMTGMRSVDSEMRDLFRTLSAGWLYTFMTIKLPSALHSLFNGLKIAVIVGIIGCITSEYIASTKGLGFIIKARSGELDVSMMFVCIFILSIIGAGAIYSIEALQRKVVFWSVQE